MGTLAEPSAACDDLMSAPSDRSRRSDEEIAEAIAVVLDWAAATPGGIIASVEDGCVTLEGTVGFRYQRQAAERAVRRMAGVLAVDNRVVIATSEAAEDLRKNLKAAILRRLDQTVAVIPDPRLSV